jgi:hypothetical protein
MHVNADGRWQAPNYMNSHKNRSLRSTRPGHALAAELNADGDMVRNTYRCPPRRSVGVPFTDVSSAQRPCAKSLGKLELWTCKLGA